MHPTPWPPHRKLAAAVFVGFLAVQLIVPAAQLFQPDRPGRFGWQMYSGRTEHPTVKLIRADGSARTVSLPKQFAAMRMEIDYDEQLPRLIRHLCRTTDDTVAVKIRSADRKLKARLPCP